MGGKVLEKVKKSNILRREEASRSDRTGGGWISGAHTAAETQKTGPSVRCGLAGVKKRRGEYSGM